MPLGNEEIKIAQTIIAVALAFLSIALVMILFFYFSRKKIVQKEIEKRELEVNHQKELLHSVLVTQEPERKRIAQDLHDDISSKLNVVALHTHLLSTPDITDLERTEIMQQISDLTGEALENSRRIAHDLLPPVFERFGLHAGIEELVLEFKTRKTCRSLIPIPLSLMKQKMTNCCMYSVFYRNYLTTRCAMEKPHKFK